MLNRSTVLRTLDERKYDSIGSPVAPNNTAFKAQQQQVDKDIANSGKLNDSNRWYENLFIGVMGAVDMAGMTLASTGMFLADMPDNVADPLSISLNGVRRLLWNMNPNNPFNYAAAMLDSDTGAVNSTINELMKKDETSKKLDFSMNDNMILPSGVTAGQFRKWWESKRDYKPSNKLAEGFEWLYKDYEARQQARGPINTGNETADYILNNVSNLGGSILGSIVMGELGGGILGKAGKINFMPEWGVGAAKLSKLNNLERLPMYNKFSQTMLTFAQTNGESVMNAMQSRESVLQKQFSEIGGADYENGLNSFVNNKILEFHRMNPDMELKGADLVKYTNQATEAYRQEWGKQHPNEYKKIVANGNAAYDTNVNLSVLKYALNWTSSGLYMRPYARTRNIMANPKNIFSKEVRRETWKEATEEGVDAAAQIVSEEKSARGEGVGYDDYLKAFFSASSFEQMAWGGLGGYGQTVGHNLLTMKEQMQKYKAQQAAIKKFDDIGRISSPEQMRDYLYLTSQMGELTRYQSRIATLMSQADKFELSGDKIEADRLRLQAQREGDKLFVNQAMLAFETGTTNSLVDNYTKLSQNEKLDPEQREAATVVLDHIQALEKIYNKTGNYHNSNEVFENRANKYLLDKQIEEQQSYFGILEKYVKNLTQDITNSKKFAGLFTADMLSAEGFPTTAGIDISNIYNETKNPYSEATSSASIPEGMTQERAKEIYNAFKGVVDNISTVLQYRRTSEGLKNLQQERSNLNLDYAELISNPVQHSAYLKNKFYSDITAMQILGQKQSKKKGKEYNPYQDKAYDTYFNERLKRIENELTPHDIAEIKADYNLGKAVSKLREEQGKVDAARTARSTVQQQEKTNNIRPVSDAAMSQPLQVYDDTVDKDSGNTEDNPLKRGFANTFSEIAKTTAKTTDQIVAEKQQQVAQADPNEIEFDEDGSPIIVEEEFSPRRKTDNYTEDQWKSMTDSIAGYVGEMAKVTGNPSFKEFMQDFIDNQGREQTEQQADLLAEAWRRNVDRNPEVFKKADYAKVIADLFSDKKGFANQWNEIVNSVPIEPENGVIPDNPAGDKAPVKSVDENGNVTRYEFGANNVLNTPTTTAAYSAFRYKQVFIPIYKEGTNELDHVEIEWVFDERELSDSELIEIERTPFSSKFINAKAVVHPDKFNAGTKLVARIHPDFENIPYTRMWKSDDFYDGLPMELAEGQKQPTYGDVLKGITVKYKVPVNQQEINPEQKYVEEFVKIEEGSQQYWDTIPIVFHEEGKSIEDGSAFVHTTDWYHPSRYVNTDSMYAAQNETKAIRAQIKQKGNVSLTVVSKTSGTFAKCVVEKNEGGIFDLLSLKKSNPQSMIGVLIGASRGGFSVLGKDGNFEPFNNDKREIIDKDNKIKTGHVYQVVRTGYNPETKKETYTALPTFINSEIQPPNAEQVQKRFKNSIRWAIDVYLNQDNPEATDSHNRAEQFLQETGYDLTSILDLKEYINSMIRVEGFSEGDTLESVIRRVESDANIPAGTPYISFINKQINIGIKGHIFSQKKVTDKNGEIVTKNLYTQTINKATWRNTSNILDIIKTTVLDNEEVMTALSKTQRNVFVNTSKEGVRKFGAFNEDGTINHAATSSYYDFLMDNVYTNIKCVNVGTQENPMYTPYIQPTVAMKLSEGVDMTHQEIKEFNDTGEVSEEVKEKIEIKQQSKIPLTPVESTIVAQGKDKEVIELSKEPATSPILTEEQRKLLAEVDKITKGISIEETDSFAPAVIGKEALNRMKKSNERIVGLLPHEQDEITDTLTAYLFEQIGYSEDSKIAEDKARGLVETFMHGHIGSMIVRNEKYIKELNTLYSIRPDIESIPKRIKKLELQINKANTVLQNSDVFINDVMMKIRAESSIKERIIEDSPEMDQGNEEASFNYSKTELEESVREQASAQIRRFLRGTLMVDKNGNPEQGFLGFPKPADIDRLFDTLTSILADKPMNFETMMEILKEYGHAHPEFWYHPADDALAEEKAAAVEKNKHSLVGRLMAADKQVQNQFVHLMGKHALKMKFIMYSFNRKTGKFTLRVWDTNSSSVTRAIQNDWNANILDKMCLVDEETGEYYIDPARAEYLLGEFDKWKDLDYPIPDTKIDTNATVAKTVQAIGGELLAKVNKGQKITVDFNGKEANTLLKAIFEKQKDSKNIGVKTYVNFGGQHGFVVVSPSALDGYYDIKLKRGQGYTQQELIDWLANIGITVTEETMKELEKVGVMVGGKGKGTLMHLRQMFVEGPKSEGLFGQLAHKLRQVVDAAHETDENGNPKPRKLMFGIGLDIDFNDQVFSKIARIEAKYSPQTMVTSWRDNNKTIYGFTPSKFVTDRVNKLKEYKMVNGEPVNELINDLRKVGFSKDAILLHLLENDPNFIDKFQAAHMGLTAIKEAGKPNYKDNSITNLSDADHEYTKIGALQDSKQGVLEDYYISVKGIKRRIPMRVASMFGLTMSDKSGMFLFQTGVFRLNARNFYNLDLNRGAVTGLGDAVKELLYNQIVAPEIRRIIETTEKAGQSSVSSYRGDIFYFLHSLNNIEIEVGGQKTTIQKYITANKGVTLEEVERNFKEIILKEIDRQINTLSKEKIETWKDAGFIKEIGAVYTEEPTGEFEDRGEDRVPITKKVLVSEGKTELSHFDKEYLHDMSESNVEMQIQLAAYDYVINYVIHNANMFMVFAGDPAIYYKKSKIEDATLTDHVRETFVNVGKRMALLNAPGNKIADCEEEEYVQLCLDDLEDEATGYQYIEKTLGGAQQAKAYLKTAGTDGQEFTTWQEHLHILEKMGKTPDVIMDITPEQITRAREIFSNEKLTLDQLSDKDKKILEKVLQPLKPVYTGQQYDAENNIMRTVYVKTSSFPLIPQLTAGLEIEKLRQMMERVQTDSGKTVRASYQSGIKTGSPAIPLRIYDDATGGFKDMSAVPSSEIMAKHGMILQRENFRIQQDVPFKTGHREEDIVSIGTQMVKLMFGSGAMELDGYQYFGDFDDNGNFVQNPEAKNGVEAHRIYQKLFDQLIIYKKQQLYSQLGLDVTGRPINIKKTSERIQKILKDEAINRGYPKQDVDSLEIDDNGNFIIPIWLLSNGERLESLLNSIVEKRISKMKFPGNSYVVGSEVGFRTAKETVLTESEKNGIVWIDETAREKGLAHNQVLVASKFRKADGTMIDLMKDGYAIRKGDHWVLDTSKFDEATLKMLNFRIPTSAHDSMSVDYIAGFLPYECADLMIVSKNKTTQKGIDFDIDKENAYHLWNTVGEDGKIVPIDKLYSLSTIDSQIEETAQFLKYLRQKGLSNATEAINESWDEEDYDDELLTEEEVEKVKAKMISESFDKSFTETKDKLKELKRIKEKLYQNEIIKLQTAILEHPKMQKNVLKVLSTKRAEVDAAYVESIKPKNSESFFALSDEYQKDKMFLGAAGKVAVGAYSLDVVGHSLFQQAKSMGQQLRLTVYDKANKVRLPYELRFGSYSSDGFLGNNKTIDGRRDITDVMSERQNIATDNEKIQVMGRVNLNDITIDADKVLNMLGFDLGEDGHSISFLFMSQPIVIDYVNEIKKISSNIAGFTKDKQKVVIEKLIEKYAAEENYNHASSEHVEKASDFLTNENMRKQIENGGKDTFMQQAILYRFIDLLNFGLDLRKLQTTVNIDSKGLGISLLESSEKIDKVEDLAENLQSIENASAVVGDYQPIRDVELSPADMMAIGYIPLKNYYVKPSTVAGSFAVHTLSATYSIWNKYFPYDSIAVNQIFKEVEKIIGATNEANEGKSNRLRVEDKQDVFREVKKYLFSSPSLGVFGNNVQEERERLFFDRFEKVNGKEVHKKASLCFYLRGLMQNSTTPDSIRRNLFLRSLTYTDIQKNGTPSTIRFNNSSQDSFEPDAIYRSMIDLFTASVNGEPIKLADFNGQSYNSVNLAQDLVAYAYLEGGIQEVIQFVKFVPVSYLKEMPFASKLRGIHDLLTGYDIYGFRKEQKKLDSSDTEMNLFGINPIGLSDDKGAEYYISKAALQYVQHHPEKVTKLTDEDVKKNITIIGKAKTGPFKLSNIEEFATTAEKPAPFLSIYDSDIPKGRKKFHLFQYDLTSRTYKRIPVYGVFGMSEYNATGNQYYKSLVNKEAVTAPSIELPVVPKQPEQAKPPFKPTGVKNIIANTNVITESNLLSLIEEIEKDQTIPTIYVDLLKAISPYFAKNNIIVKVGKITNVEGERINARGHYRNKTITIDDGFFESGLTKDVMYVYMHEIVHSLTIDSLSQYTRFLKQGSKVTPTEDAPQHIVRLVNIFNKAREAFGGDPFFERFNIKEGLTTEQDAAYGGYDLAEFAAEVMSNVDFQNRLKDIPYNGEKGKSLYQKFVDFIRHAFKSLGIDIPVNSLAHQGIIGVMETMENNFRGFLYSDRIADEKAFVSTLTNLKSGDTITFDYFSETTSRLRNTRTVKVDEVGPDYMRGFDNMTEEMRTFKFRNIKTIMEVEKGEAPKVLNVKYGERDNPELSNLYERPFEYGGRKYYSVEHAYQSLKSGQFDQQTYDKYTHGGVKIKGMLGVYKKDNANITLMENLVRASFRQNPAAAQLLLDTGDATFTHLPEASIWKTEFPRILEMIREELKSPENPVFTTEEDNKGLADLDSADELLDKLESKYEKRILDLRETMIDYTQGQREALAKIQDFIDSDTKNYFLLAGYAGTGKTTIVENIAKYARESKKGVQIIAPTNKAVSVLASKLDNVGVSLDSSTIHKTLYGAPDPITGEWIPSKMNSNTLYIIDESSMIDRKVMDDLLDLSNRAGAKILFIGDGFQLEPVGGDPELFQWKHGLFNKEDQYQLTEVKRQKEGSVLDIATNIRTIQQPVLPSASTEDYKLVAQQEFEKQFLESVKNNEDSVLITSTNKNRIKYNTMARSARYGAKAMANPILEDEKMIAVNNAAYYSNGENFRIEELSDSQGFTMNIKFGLGQRAEWKKTNMIFGHAIIEGQKKAVIVVPGLADPSLHGQQILESFFEYGSQGAPEELFFTDDRGKKHFSPIVTVATYGYAITAHKSQGSEWSKIFLDASWLSDSWNKARWLYTAVTRAKKELITIPSRFISTQPMAQIQENISKTSSKIEPKDTDETIGVLKPDKVTDLFSLGEIQQEIERISATFVDDSGQKIC